MGLGGHLAEQWAWAGDRVWPGACGWAFWTPRSVYSRASTPGLLLCALRGVLGLASIFMGAGIWVHTLPGTASVLRVTGAGPVISLSS